MCKTVEMQYFAMHLIYEELKDIQKENIPMFENC